MKRNILIHYGEIGLKKSNTDYFVGKLTKRIEAKLKKAFGKTFIIRHILRRIVVELPRNFKTKDEEKYSALLKRIFGIKNFMFVIDGPTDLKKLTDEIWENLPDYVLDPKTKPKTFCIRAKRSMNLPFSSIEAEAKISEMLLDKGLNMKGKMKDPDFQINVEFFNDHGFYSFKKYRGVGGLSGNSQGKMMALLSSGIDSPVAAYMMMKRGARIIFVHFTGYPYTDKDEMEHAKKLVEILSDFQFDTKLYIIPFGKFQKAVATCNEIPAKVRTVVYRRMMLRIAQKLSKNEKAKGIVTGDNLGQVASQTSENMFAVHEACTIPLYFPLIAFDKEDIIKISQDIGAFETSKLPCKESCTMFAPKSPELKANIYDLKEYEKNISIEEWVEKCLKEAESVTF